MLTERDAAFFRGRSLGHLATVSEQGWPQSTAVWVDLDADGETILVNTTSTRRKLANTSANPRVAISVTDEDDPYVMISVQGVVEETRPDPERAHIDSLSMRYTGQPFEKRPGEVRVVLAITPKRVYRYGY